MSHECKRQARGGDKASATPVFPLLLRCWVLVIAPNANIARWAAQPVVRGNPNRPFAPIVLDPPAIPLITDPDVARQDPEVAVLSDVAHGTGLRGGNVAAAGPGPA